MAEQFSKTINKVASNTERSRSTQSVDLSKHVDELGKLLGKSAAQFNKFDINNEHNKKAVETISSKSNSLKAVVEGLAEIRKSSNDSRNDQKKSQDHLKHILNEIKENTDLSEEERNLLQEQADTLQNGFKTNNHLLTKSADLFAKYSDAAVAGITSLLGNTPATMMLSKFLVDQTKNFFERRKESKARKAELVKARALDKKTLDTNIEQLTFLRRMKDLMLAKTVIKGAKTAGSVKNYVGEKKSQVASLFRKKSDDSIASLQSRESGREKERKPIGIAHRKGKKSLASKLLGLLMLAIPVLISAVTGIAGAFSGLLPAVAGIGTAFLALKGLISTGFTKLFGGLSSTLSKRFPKLFGGKNTPPTTRTSKSKIDTSTTSRASKSKKTVKVSKKGGFFSNMVKKATGTFKGTVGKKIAKFAGGSLLKKAAIGAGGLLLAPEVAGALAIGSALLTGYEVYKAFSGDKEQKKTTKEKKTNGVATQIQKVDTTKSNGIDRTKNTDRLNAIQKQHTADVKTSRTQRNSAITNQNKEIRENYVEKRSAAEPSVISAPTTNVVNNTSTTVQPSVVPWNGDGTYIAASRANTL